MRVIAIDASLGRGPVSAGVNAAAEAAREAGASVTVIRLRDLDIRYCTACGFCRATGACRTPDDLAAIAAELALADGVIVGAPAFLRRPDELTSALVERLPSYLRSNRHRHLSRPPRQGRSRRRPTAVKPKQAVIITASDIPEPLATLLGLSTEPIRRLRRALASGGISTLGSIAITDVWRGHSVVGVEQQRARSLGRALAGRI